MPSNQHGLSAAVQIRQNACRLAFKGGNKFGLHGDFSARESLEYRFCRGVVNDTPLSECE